MTTLVRFRLWVIGAFAVINGSVDASGGPRGNDFFVFATAARGLVSSRWASTFEDPSLQVGPLALVWPTVTGWISDVTSVSHQTVVAVSIYLVFSFGAVLAVRALSRHRSEATPPLVELIVGVGVMVVGFCWVAVGSGQPFDAVVGVLWVLVAVSAARDRPLVAGSILAAACFVKLVAVLGIPLLLLVPELRRRAGAAACFVAILVAGHLPFVVFGEVGTFDHVWRIAPDSPLALVLDAGTAFPWGMRALQAAVVVGAGTAVVHALRRTHDVVWVAPLVIAVLRLVTDPVTYSYYWLAPGAIAILGATALWSTVALRARVLLVAGIYGFGLTLLLAGPWTEVTRYVLTAALVAVAMRRRDRRFVEEAPAPV